MNLSAPFIRRPVATTLLTLAVALVGAVAFMMLPVSPLPEVDFPTISVSAGLPGASAEIMASSVATPLERQFGHIAGVTEMTSTSTLGSTSITIQFDLSRDIDGAARDVQAGINAARNALPANLPANPTYRKVNPADAPVMILGLTSDKYGPDKLYDEASTVIQQKLAQIRGVGQVSVGGGALPSVRVDADPVQLASHGLTLADLQSVLSRQNADLAKGQISDGLVTADILANDQISRADDYKPLVVGMNKGAAVRLSDVAEVTDSVQNLRVAGYLNNKRAIPIIIFRQPGANIIGTVDRIRKQLPVIQASIPFGIDTTVVLDRTTTIRASVGDVERTLLISIVLVIIVVFVFLRNGRAILIPAVAVPVSLIGTFAVMYLLGYSLDNLSLMALTISTGFVVDDAIVVMENITRHLENGMGPMAAALRGRRGDRVHRAHHQPFAHRRVHSPADDGRHRRPAVPGVRHHPVHLHRRLDGHLPDHHADDVRLPAARRAGGKAWAPLRGQRKGLRPGAVLVPRQPALGAGASAADPDGALPDGRFERSARRQDPQGVLPGGGYRSRFGGRARGAGRLVPLHGRRHPGNRRGDQEGPRRGKCDQLRRRWRGHQYRIPLCRTQAAWRAPVQRLPDHQPAAPAAEPSAHGFGVPPAGAGPAHRRPVQQRDVPVHHPGRQCAGPLHLGPRPAGCHEAPARPAGREFGPAERRPQGDGELRPGHRGEARA